MEKMKLNEELEKVVGGDGLSQEDLEKLAALLTLEPKGNMTDLMNGKCPKCKKIIATNGTAGFSSIVSEHYRNCKGY